MTARAENDLPPRKDLSLRRKVLRRSASSRIRTQLHQLTRLFAVRLVYELPELEPLKAAAHVACETDNDPTSSARAAEGRRVGESPWTRPLLFIDENLDVENNIFDRSILLHELIHHAQAVSGRFDTLSSDCMRRNWAEKEAYFIQNRYLMEMNSASRVSMRGWAARCDDAEVPTPTRQ